MCPCPPQQSLNSYQGDEDVLGLEWTDLGLNVWSGLTDQGLLMFKAALASRWHEKWQPQKGLLAPCPHSEFQFIFIPREFSSEATRLLFISDRGKSSCYELNVGVLLKFLC